jgi:hypothetical protein
MRQGHTLLIYYYYYYYHHHHHYHHCRHILPPFQSLLVIGFLALVKHLNEAASTPETSVNFCQTTQHNNPEDSHLHIRRRENLKSNLIQEKFFQRPANELEQN